MMCCSTSVETGIAVCRDVHNDVYKVIQHWVGTTDSAEKLLDIWTTFVETFFGLPLRPKEEQVEAFPLSTRSAQVLDMPWPCNYNSAVLLFGSSSVHQVVILESY